MSGAARPPARPLALTMGDPAGIGGELTLKAWRERRAARLPVFFALDDPDRLAELAGTLGLVVPVRAIASPADADTVFDDALPVLPVALPCPAVPGHPDAAHAGAVVEAIERAVDLTLAGHSGAVVTNPIYKAGLMAAGFKHPGHTEYLGALARQRLGQPVASVMMLACAELRVVPVTVHLALVDAVRRLSEALIVEVGRVTATALERDFGVTRPRLAVSGLNPHAGEDGRLGCEEIEVIAPAVARLRQDGLTVDGPTAADSLFHPAARARYDAVLCMTHDQALIPIKTIAFDRAVNVTLGLPFIRTAPDHGTAFDIAGRGVADPSSLVAALRMAGDLAARRARTAQPSPASAVAGGARA